MDTNRPDTPQQTDESLDWESRLEKLRQTRQLNAPYTHAPLVRESQEPAVEQKPKAKTAKLDDANRDAVLTEYLRKWQEEHNAMLEEDAAETAETDAMVILQENWLNAQSSLQMSATDRQIESTRTVWLNPKRKTVEFDAPAKDTPAKDEATSSENENPQAQEQVSDDLKQEMPPITVNINVLNPQVINRREVFCISEQDLSERLIKRLRPHVADAVNGMIRTAVQKQMALFTYQLQQTLSEQAPDLVEQLLDYNVKKILNDIKYEMKYSQGNKKA
ncbi:hypothetical protein [Neisseria sp. HMSC064E01]|uniref:hypothetical protein n=1 Tax=Neisseria sp. HMSC064E01 TaxID=1715052 RepID=UPI0008A39671|nr:hypothetical protein [Neisseria sp. HMSC064E01]OFN78959.1 hypothetical protein HMPREF2572_08150 [Neisseria sp. HMSC064E01]